MGKKKQVKGIRRLVFHIKGQEKPIVILLPPEVEHVDYEGPEE